MGYSEFDRALLAAWHRARERFRDDPAKLERVLRRRGMSTYTKPLRSWSLVLRACDSRIDDNGSMGLVRMDSAEIRRLCSSVKITSPVSLDEAARLFGVNRTTVSRWADPPPEEQSPARKRITWYQDVQRQIREMSDMRWPPSTYEVTGNRLMLTYYLNRADRKRSRARVWTPGFYGVDPGGEVWSADWGSLRQGLAEMVRADFSQQLHRVDRKLGRSDPGAKAPSARVFQWVCPRVDGGCGRLVYKLYLPMPWWSLVRAFGADSEAGFVPEDEGCSACFLCLRCAGLVYESAELGSSPGVGGFGARRRVNVFDRMVKRMSGGVLRGRDVFTDS